MSDTEDNRRSFIESNISSPASSTGVTQPSQKEIVRVEIGGKEEDPKDIDEKQDVEKPLMEGNTDSHRDEIEVTIEGDTVERMKDTPTLPLPPYKSKKATDHYDDDKKPPPEAPSIFRHPVARIKYERRVSNSLVEFFTKTICILFASIGWIVIIGGFPLLSIVQLVIGSVYKDKCTAEPRIPEYLIVSGFFGIIQHVVAIFTKCVPKDAKPMTQTHRRRCFCLETILQIFLIIWFLAGCSWVYGIYEPEYELDFHDNYCHKTVYLFAFWTFNITFIMMILFIALIINCIAFIAISPKDEESSSKA